MTDDLKDALTRTLGDPPPLMSAPDMLARARSADRRRTGYLAGGSAAAAVAAVAAVVVVVPAMSGSGGTGVGSPPQPPSSAAPASSAPADAVPPGRAAVPMAFGAQMTAALTNALPAGFTNRPLTTYTDAPTTFDPARNDGATPYPVNASAVVQIFLGPGEGMLTAYVARDKQPDPAGDLCATEVAIRVGFPAETCEVRTVGAARVRVTTATFQHSGPSTSATVFLGDGWLTVTEHLGSLFPTAIGEGLPPDGDPRSMAAKDGGDGQRLPKLTAMPLTPQQLAELCAGPAMLPPN